MHDESMEKLGIRLPGALPPAGNPRIRVCSESGCRIQYRQKVSQVKLRRWLR